MDRDALMRAVVSIYAEQMLIDGLFNADPHAGNIHVHVDGRGRATPVPRVPFATPSSECHVACVVYSWPPMARVRRFC